MVKKIVAAAFVAILGIVLINHITPRTSRKIIVISGTSSSGKSSVARALQKKLGNEWALIERDNLLSKQAESGQSDAEALQVINNVCDAVKRQLRSKNVIVDMVFGLDAPVTTNDITYDLLFNNLHNRHITSILVYCPLTIVLQRVKTRNSSANAREHRPAMLPFVQFMANFKPKESATDAIVDTISRESIEQVLMDAFEYDIAHIPHDKQLSSEEQRQIRAKFWDHDQFPHQFLTYFKLDVSPHVAITPQHHHDLIVNSGTHTLEAIVEQIMPLTT